MEWEAIKEALSKRQAFKANNAEAFYIGKDYHVKSYDTVIFSDYEGLDLQIYSQTTSKIQAFLYKLWYNKELKGIKRAKAKFDKIGA